MSWCLSVTRRLELCKCADCSFFSPPHPALLLCPLTWLTYANEAANTSRQVETCSKATLVAHVLFIWWKGRKVRLGVSRNAQGSQVEIQHVGLFELLEEGERVKNPLRGLTMCAVGHRVSSSWEKVSATVSHASTPTLTALNRKKWRAPCAPPRARHTPATRRTRTGAVLNRRPISAPLPSSI